jgi:hypothetical protein
MWLDSHVRGRVAVSRNLVRVIVLEVFMLAGRVFFSRVIRLGLGHDEAAFGMTERKEKDGLVNNRKSQRRTCALFVLHTPRKVLLAAGSQLGLAGVLVSAVFDGARVRQG